MKVEAGLWVPFVIWTQLFFFLLLLFQPRIFSLIWLTWGQAPGECIARGVMERK